MSNDEYIIIISGNDSAHKPLAEPILTTKSGAIWCHYNKLTLYVLNFQSDHKHLFTFYIILPHWYDTGT